MDSARALTKRSNSARKLEEPNSKGDKDPSRSECISILWVGFLPARESLSTIEWMDKSYQIRCHVKRRVIRTCTVQVIQTSEMRIQVATTLGEKLKERKSNAGKMHPVAVVVRFELGLRSFKAVSDKIGQIGR